MAIEAVDKIQVDEAADWLKYIRSLTDDKNPYRHPGYKYTVKHAEDLAPHAFGTLPKAVLDRKRPGRPAEIQKYVEESYEPVTNTEFGAILNVIGTIYGPGTFAITHPSEIPGSIIKGEAPHDIFEERFGEHKSLLNYLKDVVTLHTIGDPGAVDAMLWRTIPDEYTRIQPCIFASRQVVDYEPDPPNMEETPRISVLLDEKSEVNQGSGKVKKGNILLIFTPMQLIRAKQVGDIKDNNYEIEFIDHGLGYIPAKRLGGKMELTGNALWPKSYVAPIIGPWNKALQLETDLDGVYVNAAYPKIVQGRVPCDSCKGTGYVNLEFGKGTDKCPTCKGTKYSMGQNDPYGTLTVDMQRFPDMDLSKVMAYISPDVTIIEKLESRITEKIQQGFRALNLEKKNAELAEQSGIAKAIDRKEMEGWLRELWAHFMDHALFLYETGIRLRYSNTPGVSDPMDLMPIITPPVRFDYQSVSDLYARLDNAKKSKASPAIIRPLMKDIASKEFGKDTEITKRIHVTLDLDPFPGLEGDDLLTQNAISPLSKVQAKIKANLERYISLALEADDDFLSKPLPEQREAVEALAQGEIEAEAPVTVPPPLEDPPEPDPEE